MKINHRRQYVQALYLSYYMDDPLSHIAKLAVTLPFSSKETNKVIENFKSWLDGEIGFENPDSYFNYIPLPELETAIPF